MRVKGNFFVLLVNLVFIGLSIIPAGISPTRAVATAIPPYKVADYVTGFANGGQFPGVGPVGVAMDSSGHLYVGDIVSCNVYRFPHGPAPFLASDTYLFANTTSLGGFCPHGLAIGRDGNLYVNLVNPANIQGAVGEVAWLCTRPSCTRGSTTVGMGHVIVVTSGIVWPSGLAADPNHDDLFVSMTAPGPQSILRVSLSGTWPTTFSTYLVLSADGLVFDSKGTLYAVASVGVVAIDGPDSPHRGNWTQIATPPDNPDGIAISHDSTFLYTNNNDGTLTKIYLDGSQPPTNIVTGGTRGDFDTVGPDRCLYATQTDRVLIVSNLDGSCLGPPLGELNENSPSVDNEVYTSNDALIHVGSAVPKGVSVHDTAKVNGDGVTTPNGTVTYTFYNNGACFGPGTNQTVTLNSGLVANSTTHPSLANGDYSFQAAYNGNSNYLASTSACEWFTVGSDFDLESSGSVVADQGASGFNHITATLTNGTSSGVTLSCTSGLPSGASCSFNPSSSRPTFNSTLTIGTTSSTPLGWSTITVAGTGGGLTRVTRFLLTVNPGPPTPDFSIAASSPSPVSLGSQAVSTITLTALYSFTGTIALSDTVPSGLGCNSITPGSITLPPSPAMASLSCTSSSAGSYVVTITGKDGTLTHSTNATFTFKPPDFSITAFSPPTTKVGLLAVSTINMTALYSFTGTIALNDTVPSGLSCNAITPGNITLPPSPAYASLSCTSFSGGSYVVTITATNGTLTHSTTVIVNIVENARGPSGSTGPEERCAAGCKE